MFAEKPSGKSRKSAEEKKSYREHIFDLRNIGLNTLF